MVLISTRSGQFGENKESKLPVKLTLLHKGLLLVCIPLCFEILVFSYLINAQNHLETEAQKINRNKKINDKVNLIFSDIFDVVNLVRPTNSDQVTAALLPKRVFACIIDLRKRFDELEILAQEEPEMLRNVKLGKAEVNSAFNSLKKMKADLIRANPENVAEIIREASLDAEHHLQNLMNLGIFDWASKNQIERELLRKELWDQIRLVLECGLALSLLFAIAGCLFLSKQLVQRISGLTTNAILMGQGKALLPEMSGTDELAQLDRRYHRTARLLEDAKRMRQEVTAMITHDLRTPLQTVSGYLEMLEEGRFGELNSLGQRLLTVTVNSCHHMSKLIDNVLQLEKLRSGAIKLNTAQTELPAFLERCISSIQLVAKGKDIKIRLDQNPPVSQTAAIDPFWMEQVVVNILSNAVKFSPAGSSITVSLKETSGDATIRIKDQGPGISADDQRLIFERFKRTKSAAGAPGTGLGLAIAKELVELHGGSIDVESVEGQGATFVLRLPHTNQSKNTATRSAPIAEQPGEFQNSPKKGMRLLHKGLILVSIPLCFEITIFGLLLNLQNQVEHEANRIDQNRQINDAANIVLRDLMQVGFALRRHQRKEDLNQVSETQYRSWFEEILANLRSLENLVGNEDLENQIKRGEHGFRMLAGKLITQTKETAVQEKLITDGLAMMNYLAGRSANTEFDLHGSKLRAQTRSLLEAAIAMSVLFSALGALWYSRQIVNRLNRLSENAGRVADGQQLLAPVGGNDEIAELDRSFHNAAEQIENAKKIRQEATVMITHDLKTPLQSLRNFMEMLEDDSFGVIEDEGVKLRSAAETSIQKMSDLINNVLQLEKLRSGNLKLESSPTSLISIIEKCLASVKLLAEQKQITLWFEPDRSIDDTVDSDNFWLEQIFVNVVSNAIKFSGENSTITVSLLRTDDKLQVSVADQGVGITPENLDLIFDRYYRSESSASITGVGLGLPIAKELVELHYGSIKATSVVGTGSTFTITLPATNRQLST